MFALLVLCPCRPPPAKKNPKKQQGCLRNHYIETQVNVITSEAWLSLAGRSHGAGLVFLSLPFERALLPPTEAYK